MEKEENKQKKRKFKHFSKLDFDKDALIQEASQWVKGTKVYLAAMNQMSIG